MDVTEEKCKATSKLQPWPCRQRASISGAREFQNYAKARLDLESVSEQLFRQDGTVKLEVCRVNSEGVTTDTKLVLD